MNFDQMVKHCWLVKRRGTSDDNLQIDRGAIEKKTLHTINLYKNVEEENEKNPFSEPVDFARSRHKPLVARSNVFNNFSSQTYLF